VVGLEQLRRLRLITVPVAGVALAGSVRITIHYHTRDSLALWKAGPHGLIFTEEGTGRVHVVLHDCQCVKEQAEPDVLRVAPGGTARETLAEWSCDSPWPPPPPGTYLVTYRVLPLRLFSERSAKGELTELLRHCRSLPYGSAALWEGGWASPPVRVTLRSPAAGKPR
jgi:hypothetical protein